MRFYALRKRRSSDTNDWTPAPRPATNYHSGSHAGIPLFLGGVDSVVQPIQPKLRINAPGDRYEEEADQVADQVMRMPKANGEEDLLQSTPLIQRQVIDGESSATMPTSVMDGVHQSGDTMDASTRSFMETRFGTDFSEVNIHTDDLAIQMSRDLDAEAFVVGHDVYFNQGRYDPHSQAGQHLLAHELTHVVQQSGGRRSLQRKACPASRLEDETEQSITAGGILASNAVFDESSNTLFVQDFAVNDAELPPASTTTPAWQRVMSIIAGTPTAQPFVGVFGYSDCFGSDNLNSDLRDRRADAVYEAMPPIAQVKVLMHTGDFLPNFITTNDTAENRAKNRAVKVVMVRATGPDGSDLCDFLAVASDLDQYMFLVRCLEERLGLTGVGDAPKTLSVLRQIYYGNASWTSSANRNAIWDDVITERPWTPGDDPTPRLGPTLFEALQNSQEVYNNGQLLDIGHLLTGLDAMREPDYVSATVMNRFILGTSVENDAWATWAGDVGSAAANYVFCVSFLDFVSDYKSYFEAFADDTDLEGDIDSYANWAWLNEEASTPELQLDRPLSDVLMEYYRLTDTAAGRSRAERYSIFINYYGGAVESGRITERRKLESNLFEQVSQFALLFFGQQTLRAYQGRSAPACVGQAPPSGGTDRSVDLWEQIGNVMIASAEMTKLFVDWLEQRL